MLVDTNVLVDVLENDPDWADWSVAQLRAQAQIHRLVINPVIYAELSLTFSTVEALDEVLAGLQIPVIETPKPALFLAGKAFVKYRRKGGAQTHVLADFFIGADGVVLDAQYAQFVWNHMPFARIEELAKETFFDARGEVVPLLEAADVTALSVKRGSLTPAEYEEITSHVTHTFRFLSQIPWGKHLRRVPLIAGAHHERLNGTGYPNRLRAEEIPVQSKLMSIADIYDALTASDRPYKRAVPVERALDILEFSVKDGHVDGELVRIFREGRIWERCLDRQSDAAIQAR